VVHRRTATGNVPPVRVIQGPATQLNWPTGVAFDSERRELFVANDMGDAVLVFNAEATGDVAPIRVLKGPKTGIKNPAGLFLDRKRGELWVTNFGNHTATVYSAAASGDVAPLRTIRSAPVGKPSLMIGNPGSVTYDSKRQEILVPN
jgi:DNA-binding beta-propeller fold protein YncE